MWGTNRDSRNKRVCAVVAVLATACVLCALTGACGVLIQRGTIHRLAIVAPFFQPRKARFLECAYEVSQIRDGDTWVGSRRKRLDLGLVRAYWW